MQTKAATGHVYLCVWLCTVQACKTSSMLRIDICSKWKWNDYVTAFQIQNANLIVPTDTIKGENNCVWILFYVYCAVHSSERARVCVLSTGFYNCLNCHFNDLFISAFSTCSFRFNNRLLMFKWLLIRFLFQFGVFFFYLNATSKKWWLNLNSTLDFIYGIKVIWENTC